MHQPTTQARPSIYYTYEVFKPWLASQHPAQKRQKVVIAGSGPAGMVTALELARHGVPSVVLEADDSIGGIARTINYKGNRIDIGGHRFFSKSDRVM